jgi:hypothetical protein
VNEQEAAKWRREAESRIKRESEMADHGLQRLSVRQAHVILELLNERDRLRDAIVRLSVPSMGAP